MAKKSMIQRELKREKLVAKYAQKRAEFKGMREQISFPEIDYDKVDSIRGLDISITTTAKNDDQGRALLKAFGFPFKS
ncbi:hypothetical protein [Francisella tularensis]